MKIKKPIKQCVICKQDIMEDSEKWVKLIDYSGKIQTGEVYFHLECWQERFKITNSERKKQMYSSVTKVFQKVRDNLDEGGLVITQ